MDYNYDTPEGGIASTIANTTSAVKNNNDCKLYYVFAIGHDSKGPMEYIIEKEGKSVIVPSNTRNGIPVSDKERTKKGNEELEERDIMYLNVRYVPPLDGFWFFFSCFSMFVTSRGIWPHL